jgi:uncharacterized protein DUF997
VPRPQPSPLLATARREGLIVMGVWLMVFVYTVGYCYRFGYNRDFADLTFVLGFPDWVFWGLVVPWGVCLVFSIGFACFVMQDAPIAVDDPDPTVATEQRRD